MLRDMGPTMTLKYSLLGSAMAYAMLLAAGPGAAKANEQLQQQTSGIKPVLTTANRPGICGADEANCIYLTTRLHLDVGDYLSVDPQTPTGLHSHTSGVNARRARIGVLGKLMADWNYEFVVDFGGSTDGVGLSSIEAAFLSYQGLKPFAFEIGYMEVLWTLDAATSSND